MILALFCPSSFCTIIYFNYQFTLKIVHYFVSEEAFRYNLYQSQCLAIPVDPIEFYQNRLALKMVQMEPKIFCLNKEILCFWIYGTRDKQLMLTFTFLCFHSVIGVAFPFPLGGIHKLRHTEGVDEM